MITHIVKFITMRKIKVFVKFVKNLLRESVCKMGNWRNFMSVVSSLMRDRAASYTFIYICLLYTSKELALIRAKPLQNLVIDGCTSVSHITVNSLRASNLVAKVDCVYEREVWNRFGINSYKYRDR